MDPVGYVLRDSAGDVVRGAFEGDSPRLGIPAAAQVSLNLSTIDVARYVREGDALLVTLMDGRVIRFDGFFDTAPGAESRLYLSRDGLLTEIRLEEGADGTLVASQADAGTWGKWSPDDALIFAPASVVDDPVEVARGWGAGLLGMVPGGLGMAGAGAAAAGAAVLGAGALAGAGDDDGDAGGDGGEGGDTGSGGATRQPGPPTVDRTPIAVGGDDASRHAFDVTGTADPGSAVAVTVGGETQTVTATDDGTWSARFEGDSFPPDGTHTAGVAVPGYDPLTGPEVLIDTTPPDLAIASGTQETGDVFNAASFPGGVILSGTGEAGASVTVTVDGVVRQTVVSEAGDWSVTVEGLAAGDYATGATVVAADAMGNTTTLTGTVVIDTVPAPIAFDTVEGDGMVNAAEHADGVTISGTSEAGAVLTLDWAGATRTLTVAADGTWSADFTAAEVAAAASATQVAATVTDINGNVATASHTVIVDLSTQVAFDAGPFAGDGTVNADEAAQGVTLTGTTEPGAAVVLSVNGQTVPATVDAGGAWSVVIPEAALPAATTAGFTVTATDPAGNTATDTLVLDLDLGTVVSIDGNVTGDGVVNAAEAAQGITLTGTAEPGATVAVTFAGATRTVTATAAGTWAADFTAAEVPRGVTQAPVSAIATDAAGNTATATGTVAIDTETAVTLNTQVTADGVVNAAEAAGGLVLTGTAEPGATVEVAMNGAQRTVTATQDGTWSAAFAPAEVPQGTLAVPATATATDLAGNTATAAGTVSVDTEVVPLTADAAAVEGDGVVNAAEATDGFTLTGTVEPGSSVQVLFQGTDRAATVAADGSWQVSFAGSEVPQGAYTAPLRVTATDAAGNTRTITESLAVDTDAPDAPYITAFTKGLTGMRSIATESTTDTLDIAQVDGAGTVRPVQYTTTENPGFGETTFHFQQPIPDGSHLVVTRADAAGNATGTLFALEDTATSALDLSNPGFAQFDIGAIDLTFAADTTLTITEAQLKGLSAGTDEAVIHGGPDDTVTVPGAGAPVAARPIDSGPADVYALGTDGARLVIDDEIKVIV